MDCEKFESAMLDELYGELDELTSAAAKRHVSGCARCSARLGALRATRRLATVPLVSPPDDLETRVLTAVDRAWDAAPRRRGLAHLVSLAGSWAMRPQTAMAAVFLVMIGTSVLLLRGKSGRMLSDAEVTVIERGTPAPAMFAAPAKADSYPAAPSAAVAGGPAAPPGADPTRSAGAPGALSRAGGAGFAAAPAPASLRPHAGRAAALESKASGAAPSEEAADASFDVAMQDYR
ncbi:MAG: zf-HC2 domain-containing protein, partial [Myxococcales bacterium]|nr:zf-HC2 domain-containing protein [Myxococcales bacterium]